MLPGFRFLFAAIMLTMSILIFGLGAAALLRTAHEEVASTPSWRAAPETIFAPPAEATTPALAMLRVDAPVMEKAPDNAPVAAAPAEQGEQAAITSAPAESERIAALKPEDSSPPETAKPEIPIAENPSQNEAAPAPAEAPAFLAETKAATIASEEVSPPENQAAPAVSEQIGAPVSPGADIAATKIATLGGPPVAVATPPLAKVDGAKPDQSAIKKRQQAKRAVQRRKVTARARVAAQAPLQPASPFGQPAATLRTR
jgi:hypothetical protein